MVDIILGAGTFFVLLAINKAIVEPLATAVGRKLLDKHLGPACAALDAALVKFDLEFNAEETVREYLDLSDDEMSEDEKHKIIEAVFREWDLRKVTVTPE
jgi:hypothetical protein